MESSIVNFTEVPELIAVRRPPGDVWELLSEKDIRITGLVETLTRYVKLTGFRGAYRFEPQQGRLYAIQEKDIGEVEPVKFDLYGEM